MKDKKPDLIVWDEKRGYYPRELPYGSDLGAPSIKIENVKGWKGIQANEVNKHFKTKYEELKEEFEKLIDEVNWNELVYAADYNFIPVIGQTYHLYIRNTNITFLSLISPNEWIQNHIGSFKLDSTQKWIKIGI